MPRIDPHSYTDPEHGAIEHMSLNLVADFEKTQLTGDVILQLNKESPGVLHLDTRDLEIHEIVSTAPGVSWSLGEPDPILGSASRAVASLIGGCPFLVSTTADVHQ